MGLLFQQFTKNLITMMQSPLKLFTPSYDQSMSYERLHSINKRATPSKIMEYKTALLFHKTYNNNSGSVEFYDLFFNQNFNACTLRASFLDTSTFKVGKK